ncbi:conserved hypothetical protein [Flavobacterium sp. 9AF]|uniref:hypothetical protein n=1 Tax=Flavobacterium sp. 9AF TaxID=2653142 RepID=UPI0012F16E45|nr:hypothetical protein [Flavobacterium sp. 9AF]VXB53977.1 conserved hypothetical protein [Flavobacterium sp. 9AF]
MRKLIKVGFIGVLFVLIFACQKEENEIVQDETSLSAKAPLFRLMSRVAQNPTSHDNVLDNSNCFTVQLPVEVIVNGQQITVLNAAGYQLVDDAINANSNDDDIVNFVFPITIQFQNFESLIISNENDLHDVLEDCEEEEDHDSHEIDCVSFAYPIIFTTYDSINQITGNITIHSNQQMYNFLHDVDEQLLLSIVYPVSIVNNANQNTVVNSNEELESFLEDALEDCGSNQNSGITLESVITDGSWKVAYFFKNNQNQTSDFNGYNIVFLYNEDIEVTGNNSTINGEWKINSNSSERKLEIDLDGNELERLEEKWKVVEYSTTLVKLRLVGQGNGGNNYLYLEKN